MRFRAISRFFEDLENGDPVALTLLGVFGVVALGLGLLVWKARRDMKREDDALARKYGRKPSV
jgi:hypothetical protein